MSQYPRGSESWRERPSPPSNGSLIHHHHGDHFSLYMFALRLATHHSSLRSINWKVQIVAATATHRFIDSSTTGRRRSMSWGNGRGGRGRGRGDYYKQKYGGRGGRGRSNENDYNSNSHSTNTNNASTESRSATGGGTYADLMQCLQRLDGKSYPAYHDLDTPTDRGWFHNDLGFTLFVERAQSDPFAPPTRCRVILPAAKAGFPPSLYSNPIRRMALGDYVLRSFGNQCQQLGGSNGMGGQGWSGPKGGDIQILEPGQNILEQSGVRIDEQGNVIAQMTINLPARGRTILGQAAVEILGTILPAMVERGLVFQALNANRLQSHVYSVEDQCWVQSQLDQRNLVAFIVNGAILPRKSGVDDKPMDPTKAIKFVSPQRLQVSFTLPNAGTTIEGMGIPKGITLICGGGFHGKSTMLEAIQVGIYPKIPGDGREFCMTSPNAFKIRAEDGRNVQAVDISTFINNLPFGKDTTCFSTPDASGSSSQATNIVEAIEVGADALLIDEDTCATNFMIRDDKMMQLVAPEKEPITPFIRIVRSLYNDNGISTIMVVGGVGDYLDVADNVVVMDCYHCLDATERAKQIVASSQSSSTSLFPHVASNSVPFRSVQSRKLIGSAFAANGKVKVASTTTISYGETELDISGLEQLVTKSQTSAIANAIQQLPRLASSPATLREVLEGLEQMIRVQGLDCLAPGQFHGGMSRPRKYEIAGAINRLRREQSSIVQTK